MKGSNPSSQNMMTSLSSRFTPDSMSTDSLTTHINSHENARKYSSNYVQTQNTWFFSAVEEKWNGTQLGI